MKLRAAAALLLPFVFALSAQASSKGEAGASPTPNLLDQTMTKTHEAMDQTLILLHLKHSPTAKNAVQLHSGLELKLDVAPLPVELSKDHEVKVTVTVFNHSPKKFVHLDFPTSQRIEILVRDGAGKVVNTWSEDQSFSNDPATVTINPGERLEYSASVATREMAGGRPYVIEASFPSYPDLKIQQQVTPQK